MAPWGYLSQRVSTASRPSQALPFSFEGGRHGLNPVMVIALWLIVSGGCLRLARRTLGRCDGGGMLVTARCRWLAPSIATNFTGLPYWVVIPTYLYPRDRFP